MRGSSLGESGTTGAGRAFVFSLASVPFGASAGGSVFGTVEPAAGGIGIGIAAGGITAGAGITAGKPVAGLPYTMPVEPAQP